MIIVQSGRFASGFPAITDSFNRADNASSLGSTDTGQAWTDNGTFGISTNQMYRTSTVDGELAWITAGVTDMTTSITVSAFGGQTGAVARMTDTSNFYLAHVATGGQVTIYKCVAGGFTQLATTATAFTTGDVLGLKVAGTQITSLRNGATIDSVSDSALTTGTLAGVRAGNTSTTWRIDAFSVTSP